MSAIRPTSSQVYRERMIAEGKCIDCAGRKINSTQRCEKCNARNRRNAKAQRLRNVGKKPKPNADLGPALPIDYFLPGCHKLGIAEQIELQNDLAAGESTTELLAERYDCSERFIARIKARLRAQGEAVCTPASPDGRSSASRPPDGCACIHGLPVMAHCATHD